MCSLLEYQSKNKGDRERFSMDGMKTGWGHVDEGLCMVGGENGVKDGE